MPTFHATTPGLYPLPDTAKDDLSELKGHQKHDLISGEESSDIQEIYNDARETVIATQTDAGLDLIVEGQLRWDDMLAHPLCVHEAVETRGLLRYYDNNNFYREPVVVDELTPDEDIAAELNAAAELTDSLQAVIPGPYSLFDLATDEYYGDAAEFLTAIGKFLADVVDQFPPHDALFLLEPSLVTEPPTSDLLDRAVEAIDAVTQASNTDHVVHTYWAPFTEQVHAALLDAGIDGIGYDLVTSADENLDLINEQGTTADVALGVVDGQNTRIESPSAIRELAGQVMNLTDVGQLYLTANSELFYLPVNRFEEKINVLGEVSQMEVIA